MKKGEEIDRNVVDATKTALEVGYRHLDCAQRKLAQLTLTGPSQLQTSKGPAKAN